MGAHPKKHRRLRGRTLRELPIDLQMTLRSLHFNRVAMGLTFRECAEILNSRGLVTPTYRAFTPNNAAMLFYTTETMMSSVVGRAS